MIAELVNQFSAITAVFMDSYRDILTVWLGRQPLNSPGKWQIWLNIKITTPTNLNSQGFVKAFQMILMLPA